MSDTTSQIYFADTKAKAVFSPDGPKPKFLIDTPNFKALVVGLETGGQIPAHPGEAAMYHFLEGAGLDNPVLRQPICVFYPDESCHYSHASPFGNFATLTSRNLS